MTTIELPDIGARRYIEQFRIAAVFVIITTPEGLACIIGAGQDLAEELAAVCKVRTWPKQIDGPVLAAAWWCSDLRAAQQIVNLVLASDLRLARKDGSRLAVSVSEATAAITAAAGRLHIQLTEHAAVLARAKAASGRMAEKLSTAQDDGALKQFNAEYQRRRREAQEKGRQFPTYTEARARLAELIALAASGQQVKDIFARVFDA